MYPSKDWLNKSNNKIRQILEEVNESVPLTFPIPIYKVVKQYIPDVRIFMIRSTDQDINATVSALATHDMTNGWIIGVNGNESPKRQRFSIAHELAHIVLMPNPASIVYCGKNNDWEEKLCDIFAGNILMPDEMVSQYYNNLSSKPFLEEVATAFQVSPQVAYIRLTNNNLPFKVLYDYPFVVRSA